MGLFLQDKTNDTQWAVWKLSLIHICIMGRFINPFTDYGFKFLYGRQVEKELLISFLNDLLLGEHVITDIQFLNNEEQPEVKNERGIIYDIYCMTDTGERIIVEMCIRDRKT